MSKLAELKKRQAEQQKAMQEELDKAYREERVDALKQVRSLIKEFKITYREVQAHLTRKPKADSTNSVIQNTKRTPKTKA
jgi:uncharacterized membrane-anchored protein YhcB (DUF1043 family)